MLSEPLSKVGDDKIEPSEPAIVPVIYDSRSWLGGGMVGSGASRGGALSAAAGFSL